MGKVHMPSAMCPEKPPVLIADFLEMANDEAVVCMCLVWLGAGVPGAEMAAVRVGLCTAAQHLGYPQTTSRPRGQ